ncbi:MAG TPA: SufS family cysteine desulfurase, partial [Chloroflexota bacterium]|nr:SufS family cysteine desulfurase [Chloroflexota bacterium]
MALANAPTYDVQRIRRDFPILAQQIHGRPLVYLDSAASAQKPLPVLDAMRRFQERDYANVHRGVYALSERATDAYEQARARLARFLNARSPAEIVFTGGATAAINLVAGSWAASNLKRGDRIVISAIEHHSNIVPWQLLAERIGFAIDVATVDDAGELDLAAFSRLLERRPRLVAVAHVSNAIGSVLPVAEIARLAHAAGALVLIDGCQAVPHQPVDVRTLDCDFYVLAGHKLYGPTGIGVLYARAEILAGMPPWQGGGEMIRSVSFERTEFADPPARFEAGTPNIVGAIGLAAAADYLDAIGLPAISRHEQTLLAHGTALLNSLPGLRVIGNASHKASILSFVDEGIHPHDAATLLDR